MKRARQGSNLQPSDSKSSMSAVSDVTTKSYDAVFDQK